MIKYKFYIILKENLLIGGLLGKHSVVYKNLYLSVGSDK